MPFPKNVRDKAFVSCGRCCCICHKFCGTKMELHHIIQSANGGDDTFSNAIPLCFNCHAEVKSNNPQHPKGSNYSAKELRDHRDAWYKKVTEVSPFSVSESIMKIDQRTFIELNKYLNCNYLTWMRDTPFASGFQREYFYYLKKFLEFSDLPAFVFEDAILESAKANLADKISSLYSKSIPYVFCDDRGICCIPKEWQEKQPALYESSVSELEKLADAIWSAYCEFIRACRRKLDLSFEALI